MQPVVVEEDAVAQVGYANGPDQVERKLAEFSQVVPDSKQFKFTIIFSDCTKIAQCFILLMMEFGKKIGRNILRSFIVLLHLDDFTPLEYF